MSNKPTLIVIAGPNGSGKTSVTTQILKHEWVYTQQKKFLGYNGRTDWADRADTNGFFLFVDVSQAHVPQKIRSYPPNPPNPFSHRITKLPNAKYIY
jgi:GTPase SAR1 family protein